jgi:hypothetical protein
LRIVPSHNLGLLGPDEGEPTVYTWHWYHCTPGVALWVALALAIAVPKANRTPGVLLILVPVLGVYLVWLGVVRLLPFGSSDNEVFTMIVSSLTVGTASLWLLGHLFANGPWLKTLIGALAIAVGVTFLGALSFGLDLSGETAQFIFLLGALMGVIVLGHALAGRTCRRRYTAWRFVPLLAFWTILGTMVGLFLLFITWCALTITWPNMIRQILWYATLAGVIMGTCVTLISLPFVLIGMKSRLFRRRFLACLRLQEGSIQ